MAKILIVEDEVLIARTLAQRLGRAGYTIPPYVASGEEALQQAARELPDLVLMDMTLAGNMNGIETALQFRDLYNIPTVFLTANDAPETLERAKMARPLGYLLKPYIEEDLYRTLELALYNHGVEESLQKKESQLIFLSEATQVLTSSLKPDTVLQKLTEFSIPRLGDFCLFDAVLDDTHVNRIAIAHKDPDMLLELKSDPLSISLGENDMLAQALTQERPILEPSVRDLWSSQKGSPSSYLTMLNRMGCHSVICLPLVGNGKKLGVLTFGFSTSKNEHTLEDLELAIELGRRATIAFGHALLYKQSLDQILELQISEKTIQNLNHSLEERVTARTHELEEANRHVEKSLKEKVVLLQEVHHRVKNNLQIISSLLRMQLDRLKDQGMRTLLQGSQNRIHSMAMIHDQLYRTKDMSHINFKSYLETLLALLKTSYSGEQQNITYDLEAEDIAVDLDTAIPCGLMATELISNAIKHAFKERTGGAIRMEFKRGLNNKAFLAVEDNGVGMPASINWESSTTLGFTILQALRRQINGEISISQTTGGGARFEIQFPLQALKEKDTFINT